MTKQRRRSRSARRASLLQQMSTFSRFLVAEQCSTPLLHLWHAQLARCALLFTQFLCAALQLPEDLERCQMSWLHSRLSPGGNGVLSLAAFALCCRRRHHRWTINQEFTAVLSIFNPSWRSCSSAPSRPRYRISVFRRYFHVRSLRSCGMHAVLRPGRSTSFAQFYCLSLKILH